MIILAIDPSGDFETGKGKTGIAITDTKDLETTLETFSIQAKDFSSKYAYWKSILSFINYAKEFASLKFTELHVVIESFVIRNNGFTTGTMPETIRLIGTMEFYLLKNNIPYMFQTPTAVKTRFNDNVLFKYIPKFVKDGTYFKLNGKVINDHERDALRHLMYYNKYKEM